MAKLIHENDDGQSISFEIDKETLQDMKAIYGIDVWNEIWPSFRSEIELS